MSVFKKRVFLRPCHAPFSILSSKCVCAFYKEGLPNMARFLYSEDSTFLRKWGTTLLACSCFAGLVFGAWGYSFAGTPLAALMSTALACPVSIPCVMQSFLLPFLFSAVAVFLLLPQLLFAACFLKSACYLFVVCGLYGAFGSGGWLLHLLFLFPDLCFLVLLYSYCIHHISGLRKFSWLEAAVYLAVALAVCVAYVCFLIPFLQGIFHF